MSPSARFLALLGLTALFVWPSSSSAQPPPPAPGASPQSTEDKTAAEVRALFQEGLHHQKAARWTEAERAYLAAWQKKKTHDVAANLALVSMELKKPVQAAHYFSFALRNYPAGGSPSKRADMEAAFKDSKSQIGTLRITVNVEDARVTVNGVERGKSPLEAEVFVAPGPYVVSVRRERYVATEQKGTIEKGAAAAVDVALEPEKAAPVPTATATATATAPPPPQPRSMVPAFVIGGVGIASLITGGVLVGVAEGQKGDLDARMPRTTGGEPACSRPGTGGSTSAFCDELRSAGATVNTLGNAGIGMFVVAGATLAGAALYWFWPKQLAATTKQASLIVPAADAHGGALLWLGRF